MANDTPKGKIHWEDDFTARVLDVTHYWTANSDSGGTKYAINEQHNGVVRGGTDGTDGDLTSIFSAPIWRADKGGPLTLEIRAKLITSLADGETYLGWTDDDATDENPLLVSTADVLTSAANDAVGFMFTGAGTASWKAAGTKNTTDTSVLTCNTGGATTPVVGTYQTFKIVLNSDGDADFYIDGIEHGRRDNAITASTVLGVGIVIQGGGTARSHDVDYVEVWAGRN